ncbi:hypothetical protein [Brevundimonas sp.]|uniref:hypothetical protein n=1 Tax=Brevundimonas sp. TaxID=1871086 RepID=UPI0028983A02|nr:hypothetical protein [Brevundimonas sp.]
MISTRHVLCLLILAAPGLAQCDRHRPERPPEAPAASPAPQTVALDRAGIIAALARAASTYAAGDAPQEALVGRRFVVRLPFGCQGGAETPEHPGFASWSRTTDGKDIDLRLDTADWLATPPVDGADLAAAWANADGVWITRPWLSLDTCPPPPPAHASGPLTVSDDETPSEPPSLIAPFGSEQTAGLVFYAPVDGSRIGRREGQPYVHLIRGEVDQPAQPPTHGWRVLIEGRIGAFPDGRSIRCRAPTRDARPTCVAAVQVDKLAFEDGSTGRQLAEWRPGG